MPGCLFCAVAEGTTPAVIVHEDPEVLAFLDHRPLFLGHTLVIPRTHHETLADVPATLLSVLFERVQDIERAVRAAMGAPGTFVAMNNTVSQSVPHLHVHVVPRRPKDGLRGFFWPRTRYGSEQEMAETGTAIADTMAGLRS